jgi:hypothetical protein
VFAIVQLSVKISLKLLINHLRENVKENCGKWIIFSIAVKNALQSCNDNVCSTCKVNTRNVYPFQYILYQKNDYIVCLQKRKKIAIKRAIEGYFPTG